MDNTAQYEVETEYKFVQAQPQMGVLGYSYFELDRGLGFSSWMERGGADLSAVFSISRSRVAETTADQRQQQHKQQQQQQPVSSIAARQQQQQSSSNNSSQKPATAPATAAVEQQ